MDWYITLKFIHVTAAILWLGGGTVLVALAILANRAGDADKVLAIIGQVVAIAPLVFMPGSLIVLATGLAMVWGGGLAWDAWILFGLTGIAITAGLGFAVLGPACERIARLAAEGRRGEALAQARSLLATTKFDYTLQFLIVFAMIAKPVWQDVALLGAMVMIAVAAFVGFVLLTREETEAA